MRIVVTLHSLLEMKQMSALGADVFLVNSDCLSTKTMKCFSKMDIATIIEEAHQINKLVYVNLNTIIHEPDIPILEAFLSFLAATNIDGIVCFDLSVVALAEQYGLNDKIIYQPGTMNTNSYDPWFFRKLKIKGITLSKDITLAELIAIGENYQGMEISLVGHGYSFLFYSKRLLLKSYFEYRGKPVPNLSNCDGFRLIENQRPEEMYPIYEDGFGTHIFRSRKLQSFNEVKVMRPYLSDFFVDRMFIEDEEYYASIGAYKDETNELLFLNRYGNSYDSGFYYQKNKERDHI
ncbi:MAG: U32 family peptidase [Candidatus Izemoplasmatales bacterium]|nr:U32 family peptidase [Candidatus Izemoplasmatales bacterium]